MDVFIIDLNGQIHAPIDWLDGARRPLDAPIVTLNSRRPVGEGIVSLVVLSSSKIERKGIIIKLKLKMVPFKISPLCNNHYHILIAKMDRLSMLRVSHKFKTKEAYDGQVLWLNHLFVIEFHLLECPLFN